MTTIFSDYIQLPPDGGGKRTHANSILNLNYNTAGGNTFSVGDRVTGATSGFVGDVLFAVAITSDLGAISLRPVFGSTVFSTITGEDLNVLGSPIAKADDTGILVYIQNTHIAGANNPFNAQFVDERGAAYVRFSDGPQQIDALGRSKVSESTIVGDYSFEYGDNTDEFQTALTGSGTQIENSNGTITLQVGTTSGHKVCKTSNKYHLFNSGSTQLIEMLVNTGDTGKTNLRRRWGYFDDNDGAYFELTGTTFNVVIRSSVTGSPVNTVVAQIDFNTDKIDGSGAAGNLSHADLQLDKINFYWIDMHWRRVRFGVYDDGQRITAHDYVLDSVSPLFSKFNLPVRFEIENIGIVASTSELILAGTNVKVGADIDLRFQKSISPRSIWGSPNILDGGTGNEYYIATYKSVLTIGGKVNRKITIPTSTLSYVTGGDVVIRIYKNCTVTGTSYISLPGTAVRIDLSGDISVLGPLIATTLAPAGTSITLASETFSYLGDHLRLNADGADGNSYTITAEPLSQSGSDPVTITSGANWIDVG